MSDWILLRGLTRESRHWGELASHWEARGLGRPALLDLPGNGAHAQAPVPPDVRGMVAFLRAQAQAAGLRPPFRLLAMSLGAMVAAEWARVHPGEIAALVLVNTSMRPFSAVTERLRPRNWPALLGVTLRWHDRPHCERVIHRLTCERHDTREADIATWVAIAHSAPVSRGAALRQLMAAARFGVARHGVPPCPVLILSSAADRLVDPVCSQRLAAAWGAHQREHPWAGHDLPHDDPDWLCEVVAATPALIAPYPPRG